MTTVKNIKEFPIGSVVRMTHKGTNGWRDPITMDKPFKIPTDLRCIVLSKQFPGVRYENHEITLMWISGEVVAFIENKNTAYRDWESIE